MEPSARDNFVTLRNAKKKELDDLMGANQEMMEKGQGAVNKDDKSKFKANLDQIDSLRDELRHLNTQLKLNPAKDTPEVMEELGVSKDEDSAFRRWAQSEGKGDMGMSAEERSRYLTAAGKFRSESLMEIDIRRQAVRLKVAEARGLLSPEEGLAERRKLAVELARYAAFDEPTDGSGVPVVTVPGVTYKLKSLVGIRSLATVFMTPKGEDMDFTNYDPNDREGEEVARGSSATEDDGQDLTHITLGAHQLSSKRFPVSRKLIMNAAFPVEEFVRAQLGRSMALRENKVFSGGTGSGQAQGYRGLAADGITSAAATSFTLRELNDLRHALDPAIRAGMMMPEGPGGLANMIVGGKGACWVMHDTVLGYIRGLEDTQGRQLWERDYKVGEPDTLFGYPVALDQHAPALGSTRRPAAGNKLVYFGDFSYYAIRESTNGHLDMLLDTTHVGANNIGFLQWKYIDGNVVYPRDSMKVECIRVLTQRA